MTFADTFRIKRRIMFSAHRERQTRFTNNRFSAHLYMVLSKMMRAHPQLQTHNKVADIFDTSTVSLRNI